MLSYLITGVLAAIAGGGTVYVYYSRILAKVQAAQALAAGAKKLL